MTRPAVLARVAGVSIALLRSTLRIERRHFERYAEVRARGVPILFSLWHGRMFVPIQVHRNEGIVTMASRSADGEIIALWLARNGYRPVRGSSTRGGSEALRAMVREVRAGRNAALTVDGPTGPPRVVRPGVVELARLTGAWILPMSYASSRPRFLASWDRYLVPMPFSRNVVVWGEAFAIPEDWSDETAAAKIASALDGATREADEAVGVAPPPPWA